MVAKSFFRLWILLGFLFFLTGCNDKIEPGTIDTPPPAVIKTAVATAVISNQPFIYEALGTITARDSTTLSGKIMGAVKAVNVKEGDPVKKGDVLVVLDERQVAAGLRQSEAGLDEAQKARTAAESAREAARAGAELAQATYSRYQKLYNEESATRQEFEEVEARHRQARAALSQAEVMVQQSLTHHLKAIHDYKTATTRLDFAAETISNGSSLKKRKHFNSGW